MNCCSHLFEIDNVTPKTPNPLNRVKNGAGVTLMNYSWSPFLDR